MACGDERRSIQTEEIGAKRMMGKIVCGVKRRSCFCCCVGTL